MKLTSIRLIRLAACVAILVGMFVVQNPNVTALSLIVYAGTFMYTIERMENVVLTPLDKEDETNKEDENQ